MEDEIGNPLSDAPNGRGPDGKFARGNKLGKGSPLARKAASLRAALFDAFTVDDIVEIAASLKTQCKACDVPTIKLTFGYLLGKPVEHDFMERLCALESAAGFDGE